MYHGAPMNSILNRYLFREISIPFFLGLLVFTFVLLMGRLLKLAEMVIGKGVPLSDILLLVLYITPSFCLVTIPMAFLLAVLLGFGRLSSDSEITAMKSCGISMYGMLPPLFAFAVVAWAATTFMTVYALPWGQSSFKKLMYDIVTTRSAMLIKERVFNDDFPGMVIYLDRYNEDTGKISHIIIQDERNPADPSTIMAERGVLSRDSQVRAMRLHLENGTIHRTLDTKNYRLIHFNDYDVELKLNSPNDAAKLNERDLTMGELRRELATTTDNSWRLLLEIELHRRFSLPCACFVFAILGMPLGMQNRRSGKSSGFSLSIAILLVYYVMLSIVMSLGEKGVLPPAIGLWLPNIILLIPGIYLFRAAAAEQRPAFLDLPERLLEIVRPRRRERTA